MIKPLPIFLREIDDAAWIVHSSATDYPDGWVIEPHSHNKDQLIHAIEGVMVVYTDQCQWTVPPNRGIWMPSGRVHSIRCAGTLKMRSVFIQAGRTSSLPAATTILSISPLLSELIKASVGMKLTPHENSRESRIMNLILDEISLLPAVPPCSSPSQSTLASDKSAPPWWPSPTTTPRCMTGAWSWGSMSEPSSACSRKRLA